MYSNVYYVAILQDVLIPAVCELFCTLIKTLEFITVLL